MTTLIVIRDATHEEELSVALGALFKPASTQYSDVKFHQLSDDVFMLLEIHNVKYRTIKVSQEMANSYFAERPE